ncbi:hypothetical protein GGR56DRAFT_665790 [Xylariaceae sp. FL0804]|nr:hypothetical protein GGR56DRAFT_665790 [Xylariaceae sp. FL0804]
MRSENAFQVEGRVLALITGGSRGMGFSVARQLAAKGASVVIVARDCSRLLQAVVQVQQSALDPAAQHFHQISADMTSTSEAVWCCTGACRPSLFIDTPVSAFSAQMDDNYFTSLYMAHAILRHWLQSRIQEPSRGLSTLADEPGARPSRSPPSRHIIFTASFVSFYSFAGFSPYSPSKAALRSLSDSLSQEMNLYAAANPGEPRVRVHTVFPAKILTEGLEAEEYTKSDLTKLLEEADTPKGPGVIASRSIEMLESGQEMITTDFLTWMFKGTMLGGSGRGGVFRGLLNCVLAGPLLILVTLVHWDMDRKVRIWGRQFGVTGRKT